MNPFLLMSVCALWFVGLGLLAKATLWIVAYWEPSSQVVLEAIDSEKSAGVESFPDLVRARERMLSIPPDQSSLHRWSFALLPELPLDELGLIDGASSVLEGSEPLFGDLDFKIAGVEIKGAERLVRWLGDRPKPRVKFTISDQPEGLTLFVEASRGRAEPMRWRFIASEKGLTDEKSRRNETARLVDLGLIHAGRWMRPRMEGSGDAGMQLTPIDTFPSEQAELDYRAGLLHLVGYFDGQDNRELTQAVDRFQRLRQAMPQDQRAAFLLGLVQSEARHEDEAIHSFDEILEVIPTAGTQTASTLLVSHARLLQATARLKQYRWNDAIGAWQDLCALARELEHEIDLIDQRLGDKSDGKSRSRLPKHEKEALQQRRQSLRLLVASAYTQAGRAVAHLVPILRFAEDGAADEAAHKLFGLAAFVDPAELLQPIEREVAQLRKKAEEAAIRIEAKHASSKLELELRRNIDMAYLKYRLAEWLDVPKNDTFLKEAQAALRALATCGLSAPRDYTILQNQAAILSDPRLAELSDRTAEAMDLWNRSLELKPDDYWGYQQRARLRLLQLAKKGAWNDEEFAAAQADIARASKLRTSSANTMLERAAWIVQGLVHSQPQPTSSSPQLDAIPEPTRSWLLLANALSRRDCNLCLTLLPKVKGVGDADRVPWRRHCRKRILEDIETGLKAGTLSDSFTKEIIPRMLSIIL